MAEYDIRNYNTRNCKDPSEYPSGKCHCHAQQRRTNNKAGIGAGDIMTFLVGDAPLADSVPMDRDQGSTLAHAMPSIGAGASQTSINITLTTGADDSRRVVMNARKHGCLPPVDAFCTSRSVPLAEHRAAKEVRKALSNPSFDKRVSLSRLACRLSSQAPPLAD